MVMQNVMLLVAALAYLAGGVASVAALMGWRTAPYVRSASLAAGILISATLLTMHSLTVVRESGGWQPLQDNLSALLTLSVLLALFVGYLQLRRPIPSLEWIIMPTVIVLLLLAGHFGSTQPQAYLPGTYSLVHRIFTYVGAVAFVIAGAAGTLYLISDHNLRKRKVGGPHFAPSRVFGSLERLERITYNAVTLGFALFTVGVVSGVAWGLQETGHERLGEYWYVTPKVVLGMLAWLLFAVVLHSPVTPRLRGRKNALLSIAGLVLTLASLVAVLLMPSGGQS